MYASYFCASTHMFRYDIKDVFRTRSHSRDLRLEYNIHKIHLPEDGTTVLDQTGCNLINVFLSYILSTLKSRFASHNSVAS